jgi:hypothetical protein
VEFTLDTDPFPINNQNLYWFFTGTVDDPSSLEFVRAYATLSPRSNGTFVVTMADVHTPNTSTLLKVDIPNQQFLGRMLLSFSLILSKLPAPDMYDLFMAIYLNGTRIASTVSANVVYEPLPGYLTAGRWLPCASTGGCNPFLGTMHSVAVDSQPLDNTVAVYDEWEPCTAAAVPVPAPTSSTTVQTSPNTTGGSDTTTTGALVFTGGDLDGGGAVGLDEEESSGNRGTALPLTLIIVLAVAAVTCALSLGALLVWRSRRRRTMALATDAKPSPASASSAEQALPRSRSSKRRRGDGNYAAVAVADGGTGGTDYSAMPSVGSVSDGSAEPYRTLPSDDRGEYRTMPAGRTHGYGQVGTSSSQGTYTELKRTKPMSPSGADYATGELELSEL